MCGVFAVRAAAFFPAASARHCAAPLEVRGHLFRLLQFLAAHHAGLLGKIEALTHVRGLLAERLAGIFGGTAARAFAAEPLELARLLRLPGAHESVALGKGNTLFDMRE